MLLTFKRMFVIWLCSLPLGAAQVENNYDTFLCPCPQLLRRAEKIYLSGKATCNDFVLNITKEFQ